MTTRRLLCAGPVTAVLLAGRMLGAGRPSQLQHVPAVRLEATRMQASGGFEITMTPQSMDTAQSSMLSRMLIAKHFHGGLEGTSTGEMLAARTAVPGSAGYVAMEQIEGTLDGRQGSFVLQHTGTMDKGAPQLHVSVVPDSGTGELTGLIGTMTIDPSGGKHTYVFAYALPPR